MARLMVFQVFAAEEGAGWAMGWYFDITIFLLGHGRCPTTV